MKYIATDCDGVLLEWRKAFEEWMRARGYEELIPESESYWLHDLYGITHREITQLIGYFNSSAQIGFLKPYARAETYVSRLASEGYKFVCITSMGPDKYARLLRKKNIIEVFGNHFEDIVCLEYRANKKPILKELHEKYKFEWWLEDHVSNANKGIELGIKSIIFDAIHNREGVHDQVKRVDCWAEAYEMISGNK